ncbi:hypothetical protein [uncultured Sulfitobacter sp.]|uniref:hypothetical protein n=1 Tax=uncultured Sulfitobacter sp. TaxID=191468 RepID=UPI00260F182E|nr:hypothetical protein [uncultured Sulfitobacter sp.]
MGNSNANFYFGKKSPAARIHECDTSARGISPQELDFISPSRFGVSCAMLRAVRRLVGGNSPKKQDLANSAVDRGGFISIVRQVPPTHIRSANCGSSAFG